MSQTVHKLPLINSDIEAFTENGNLISAVLLVPVATFPMVNYLCAKNPIHEIIFCLLSIFVMTVFV